MFFDVFSDDFFDSLVDEICSVFSDIMLPVFPSIFKKTEKFIYISEPIDLFVHRIFSKLKFVSLFRTQHFRMRFPKGLKTKNHAHGARSEGVCTSSKPP